MIFGSGFLGVSAQAEVITAADDAYVGLLFRTESDGKFLKAPLLATSVDIHVTGPIARTRVRQFYQNPTDQWLEGVYVFPLPDKSAVDAMLMRIGDREVIGVIEERQKARQMYEKAKQSGKRAALVESERPNIFTTSVANIGPNDGIMIEIEYQEVLSYDNGEFRLRFPMVVGPRYIPGGVTVAHQSTDDRTGSTTITMQPRVIDAHRITPPVQHPDAGKINPLSITVILEGGLGVTDIRSHHHQVTKVPRDGGRMEIHLAEGPVPADRDFELTWSPAGAETEARFYTETINGAGYGLVMLSPPAEIDDEDYRLRETIFIIDTSGSMQGTSIKQARASLQFAVDQLSSLDMFNIIQFNSVHDLLWRNAQLATPRNRQEASRYIANLSAEGGTEMAPALHAALDGVTDPERLRHVVFITDGSVGNAAELFQLINARLGDSRLFTVGIGSAPNSHFMTGAAEMGRGTFTYIGSPDQVTERMGELWRKLLSPALTHIVVSPDGNAKIDLWPKPLPDLFSGKPLSIVFRWTDQLDGIAIDGRIAQGSWHRSLDMSNSNPGVGIAKLWAREKIHALEAELGRGANADDIRQKVLATALTYGLVTKHTSLVAIDNDVARRSADPLHRSEMPTNLPQGWDYESVFGPRQAPGGPMISGREQMLAEARMRYATASVPLKSTGTLAAPPMKDASNAQKLRLPRTATNATLLQLGGGVLLALSLLFHLLIRRRVIAAPPTFALRSAERVSKGGHS